MGGGLISSGNKAGILQFLWPVKSPEFEAMLKVGTLKD
jgi:hypothetical protein